MSLRAAFLPSESALRSKSVLYAIQGCHAFSFIFAAIAASHPKSTKAVAIWGGIAFALSMLGQIITSVATNCLCCDDSGDDFDSAYPGAVQVIPCLCIILWVFFIISDVCMLVGLIRNGHTNVKGLFTAASVFGAFTMLVARYYYICYVVATGTIRRFEVESIA